MLTAVPTVDLKIHERYSIISLVFFISYIIVRSLCIPFGRPLTASAHSSSSRPTSCSESSGLGTT